MALVKCPRCELNYILDGGSLCTVCRREVNGEREIIDTPELCANCGENPVAPGSDLCYACLKEKSWHAAETEDGEAGDEEMMSAEAKIGIDSVSGMDEIEMDIVDEKMAKEFGAEDEFKDQDDDLESGDDLSTEELAEKELQDDADDLDE